MGHLYLKLLSINDLTETKKTYSTNQEMEKSS